MMTFITKDLKHHSQPFVRVEVYGDKVINKNIKNKKSMSEKIH